MEPISEEEVQEVRQILGHFYSSSVVANWHVTVQTYEVLGRIIVESEKCTRAMHLVPRPWNLSNPIGYARRQTRQAITRFLRSDEGKHYLTCMRGTALKYRSAFELASHGL